MRAGRAALLPVAKRVRLLIWARGDCWEWRGHRQGARGYGRLSVNKVALYAHRVAYEIAKGPIPEGYDVDHLCRHPWCVRPTHLEVVSRRTNLLRGQTLTALHAAQTHCLRGHEYTPENTYRKRSGWRECRACARALAKARYQRAVRGGKPT